MFGFGKKPLVPLRVSAAAYDELASMISAVDADGALDMTGICLTRAPEQELQPKHRPISRNTAPGAI